MAFTDEDLKRLKEAVGVHKNQSLFCDRDRDTYKRLLARLEAAELVCYAVGPYPLSPIEEEKLRAWRKAAGK